MWVFTTCMFSALPKSYVRRGGRQPQNRVGLGPLGAASWWGTGSQAVPHHPGLSQPVSASAAHILGEVCREKQEAAVPLVRLFLQHGRVVPFISAIANAEVRRTQ